MGLQVRGSESRCGVRDDGSHTKKVQEPELGMKGKAVAGWGFPLWG